MFPKLCKLHCRMNRNKSKLNKKIIMLSNINEASVEHTSLLREM